jgi:iron complex transport system ATP-binding protein
MSLSAAHVTYTYRQAHGARDGFALHDASVAIPRGTLAGLLGPNGGGKTTLLKLLAGVLKPDSGAVTLDGAPLAAMERRAVARRVAVVPQETHPAFDFTVMEMALLGRHPHLARFELEGPRDVAIAREALEATGTAHLSDRLFRTLSGGEKQRVVIASALAQQPDILLLDEPTASLDLGFQLEIAALLRELNRARSVTMVLATHDLNLAASICGAVVMLSAGRVVAQGRTADVLTRARIEQLYGVDADVQLHERAGHLLVIPVGRTGDGRRDGTTGGAR